MMIRSRTKLIMGILVIVSVVVIAAQYLFPVFTRPPQAKPELIIENKVYEYYILIDQETGEVLGHVSSLEVTTGDEYISENNKRYVVIRVEENRAYMNSFGPADGGEDKGEFKKKTN